MRATGCIVWLLVIATWKSTAQRFVDNPEGSACVFPDQRAGVCTLVRDCPSIRSLLSSNQRNAVTQLLQRAICSFQGRYPVICCPHDGNSRSVKNGHYSGKQKFNKQPQISIPVSPIPAPVQNPLLPKNCGSAVTDYIVGGTKTSLGEHPWLAGLEYQTRRGVSVSCGGALINDRYVLTAAHCLARIPGAQFVSVRLGEHDLTTNPDCESTRTGRICSDPIVSVPYEQIIIHPQYKGNNDPQKNDDIGLIRLKNPVKFTDYVRPVCLPSGDMLTTNHAGSQQTVAGWGRTESEFFECPMYTAMQHLGTAVYPWESATEYTDFLSKLQSSSSNLKLRVTLPILTNARCAQLYGQGVTLTDKQMCAGGQAGKDSCNGDSGGPIMTITRNKWVMTGLVSVGPQKCGTQDLPGIYTRVASYLPWIMQNLRP